MSIMNQNPLIPNGNIFSSKSTPNVSPQEWEYIQTMRRTGWQESPAQQPQQLSDPYSDFEAEFSKCSTTVQNKILNDEEFKKSMQY